MYIGQQHAWPWALNRTGLVSVCVHFNYSLMQPIQHMLMFIPVELLSNLHLNNELGQNLYGFTLILLIIK